MYKAPYMRWPSAIDVSTVTAVEHFMEIAAADNGWSHL